jgi:hypothetical protein
MIFKSQNTNPKEQINFKIQKTIFKKQINFKPQKFNIQTGVVFLIWNFGFESLELI